MSGKRRYSLTKGSTKKCSKCGQFKNVAEFGWQDKSKGWKSAWCRKCAKKKSSEYYQARKAPIDNYLKNHPCVDCGFSDYRALDFDHVRGEKLDTVSQMWSKPWPIIAAEIAKCEVRCRNCHHIRHLEEGFGESGPPISNKDAIEYYGIEEEDAPQCPQMSLFTLSKLD